MNKIFKEAARQIAEGEERFSCLAVGAVALETEFYDARAISDRYALIISPVAGRDVIPADFDGNPDRITQDGTNHRVIALLMVGEAWKDLQ